MSRDADTEFEMLVREHAAMVARIASTYEKRPALIEELTQDVFLAVHRALPAFRGDSSLKTLIARIATNVCIDHVRRAVRHPREVDFDQAADIADPDTNYEARADLEMRRERLVQAVRDLDAPLKQVISLHLEGFSNLEIAEVLSLSASNVGVRLHRARTALEKTLVREAGQVVSA